MEEEMLDNKCKAGHARGRRGRTAALFATVAISVCMTVRLDGAVIDDFEGGIKYDVYQPAPPLAIRPATLLTWPETPVPCMVEAAPDPDGPWTPCVGDYHEVVEGQHRMYLVPDEQAKCFRSAATTLLSKDFTDLSGWNTNDTRITTTVTNDDVLLHFNMMSPTPLDNMANWGGSIYPISARITIPTTGTLELRCDVVGANQDDAFASVSLWRVPAPPFEAYGFSKDQNEIIIWKIPDVGLFHAEEVAIKNENITLSLALTPRGSDLEIHARVFDRDNHNALLWEKVVTDTPAADPMIPTMSWKGLVTASDVHPAPHTGTNFVPIITCSYWNAQRAPNLPGAEVIFDSLTVLQYSVPALAVGPAALLSWTEEPVACRIVETATSLPGPWTTLFTGCSNFVNGRYRTFVPANEPARFFRLSEGSLVRIISWPTNISVPEGSNITLRVEARGLDPLSYEWRFDGEVLEGITGNSFTIDKAALSDQGAYVVTVSDACGSVTTNAILKVLVPPTIVQHPQSQTVRVGDTVTFSVSVTNTATLPVGYRWRHGGLTLTNQPLNAHTSTYTINNVQLGDAGDYTVVVTNAAKYPGGYVSDRATLTVGP